MTTRRVTEIFLETLESVEVAVGRLVPDDGEWGIVVGQAVAILHDGPAENKHWSIKYQYKNS
jgi:hypothetical protein